MTAMGNGWKRRLPIALAWKNNSLVSGIAITSEVVFSMEIVSLPVGGTMTRIACGSTMCRRVCMRLMPSAVAASS